MTEGVLIARIKKLAQRLEQIMVKLVRLFIRAHDLPMQSLKLMDMHLCAPHVLLLPVADHQHWCNKKACSQQAKRGVGDSKAKATRAEHTVLYRERTEVLAVQYGQDAACAYVNGFRQQIGIDDIVDHCRYEE